MKDYTPPKVGVPVKKPKRCMSAFIFFVKERRLELVKANPKWSFGELGRKMGEEWRGMADKKKGKYNKQAAADRVRYQTSLISLHRQSCFSSSSHQTTTQERTHWKN